MDNYSITFSGNRAQTMERTDAVATVPQEVMVQVQKRKDFLMVINVGTKEFVTAAGDKITPIVYKGSTYLLLRAIGHIMGIEVAWIMQQRKNIPCPFRQYGNGCRELYNR